MSLKPWATGQFSNNKLSLILNAFHPYCMGCWELQLAYLTSGKHLTSSKPYLLHFHSAILYERLKGVTAQGRALEANNDICSVKQFMPKEACEKHPTTSCEIHITENSQHYQNEKTNTKPPPKAVNYINHGVCCIQPPFGRSLFYFYYVFLFSLFLCEHWITDCCRDVERISRNIWTMLRKIHYLL